MPAWHTCHKFSTAKPKGAQGAKTDQSIKQAAGLLAEEGPLCRNMETGQQTKKSSKRPRQGEPSRTTKHY